MMLKILLFLLCILLSIFCISCVSIGRDLVNEEGTYTDVYGYFNVPERVRITFEVPDYLYNVENIQNYDSDPLQKRFKYSFCIPTPVLPVVKLNSFSFTDEKGNIIPCILYYKSDDKTDGSVIINIIGNLPAVFTNDIKKEFNVRSFEIFAECSQSFRQTETIYVNYDIEVGDTRFVKQIRYRKKFFFDWRPKLW